MSGYLIAVHYTDSNTSIAHDILIGVENGDFPDQATAIAAAKATVTSYVQGKGQVPTSMVALVSATR